MLRFESPASAGLSNVAFSDHPPQRIARSPCFVNARKCRGAQKLCLPAFILSRMRRPSPMRRGFSRPLEHSLPIEERKHIRDCLPGLRNDWKHRISMKDIFLYLQLTGMVPDFQFPAELYRIIVQRLCVRCREEDRRKPFIISENRRCITSGSGCFVPNSTSYCPSLLTLS